MAPDPTLYMGPNGAILCAQHRGRGGRRPLTREFIAAMRDELHARGLVARPEPLCEACRCIANRGGHVLTGGDA